MRGALLCGVMGQGGRGDGGGHSANVAPHTQAGKPARARPLPMRALIAKNKPARRVVLVQARNLGDIVRIQVPLMLAWAM